MKSSINNMTTRKSTLLSSGFSLVELLVVIGILALLATISIVGYVRVTGRMRWDATRVTIQKSDQQLKQMLSAFNTTNFTSPAKTILARELRNTKDEKAALIIVKKRLARSSFPQRFEDLVGLDGIPGAAAAFVPCYDSSESGYTSCINILELGNSNSHDDPPLAVRLGEFARKSIVNITPNTPSDPPERISLGNHDRVTESAELLYFILTQGDVQGFDNVTKGDFLDREAVDTDKDGLLEIVDAWGRPVRFYRWPTRLVRPDGFNFFPSRDPKDEKFTVGVPNRGNILLTIWGSRLDLGSLSRDPDDDVNRMKSVLDRMPDDDIHLLLMTGSADSNTSASVKSYFSRDNRFHHFERSFHTIGTYHTPLIISCGEDGELGLYEPFVDYNNNNGDPADDHLGTLAQPLPTTIGTSSVPIDPNTSVLADDITSQKLE
jgi:prepilin-type N-terminal cleavage/methylation domain-containing protein